MAHSVEHNKYWEKSLAKEAHTYGLGRADWPRSMQKKEEEEAVPPDLGPKTVLFPRIKGESSLLSEPWPRMSNQSFGLGN